MARYQIHRSSCGTAALQNALEALGIERSEDELIALCKTTPEGTDWKHLLRAVRTIDGVRGVEIAEQRADVAILRLVQSLYEGRPAIVCVEQFGHYAVAGGVLGFGKRIVCVDAGDNALVLYRTIDEFVEWWAGPEEARKRFTGVVL